MDLTQAIDTYFRGERNLAFVLVTLGGLYLAVGYWALRTQSAPFALWFAGPLLVLGVGLLGGGASMERKTVAQVSHLKERLAEAPADALAVETARMAKVNANWPRLKATWGALILGALVLLNVVKRDWADGVGLAIIVVCACIYCIDVFAERRAVPYAAALAEAASATLPAR